MSEASKLKVVREWLTLAEADLNNADNIFRLELDPTYTTICFHAQQCVEKMVKAALVWYDVNFPKTHDLSELFGLLKPHLNLNKIISDPSFLTTYAITTRYPGAWAEITRTEVEAAMDAAVKISRKLKEHFVKIGLEI